MDLIYNTTEEYILQNESFCFSFGNVKEISSHSL